MAEISKTALAFFVKKDYVNAVSKYSDAIAEEPNNAILYANRAACYAAMQRHNDAASDAKKATEIDPRYAKAWQKLGAAQDVLSLYPESIESYQQAIALCPKNNLSPSQSQQKEIYEKALKVVMSKILNPETMSFDIVSAMARAHDIPVPTSKTPNQMKALRRAIFNHPKFTTQPLLRLLLIPQSQTEPLRQVELDRERNVQAEVCKLLGCDLSDSIVLHSEDQIAYDKGRPHGVGVGRIHTSYEAFMDDSALLRRPLNRRASELLCRPKTHGPILVMKTVLIKSQPSRETKSEDILCWDRISEEDLRSDHYKKLREEWVRMKGSGDPKILEIRPA